MRLTDPGKAGRRLTVVTFHRVLGESERQQYPLPGLAVTLDEFRWHLKYFTHHYECGPLAEMVEQWLGGNGTRLPLLAVTFDDGQFDNYENARSILDDFKVRATFYVPAKHIEDGVPIWHDRLGFAAARILNEPGGISRLRRSLGVKPALSERELAAHVVRVAKALGPAEREAHIQELEELAGGSQVPEWASMMSWCELKELAEDGHEIGSHTMTHPILTQCSEDEIDYEVRGSRALIEKRLGTEIRSFCYPDGARDKRAVSAVRRAGYRYAVTTAFGTNGNASELYRLRRCEMHSDHARSRRGELSEPRLALRLSGL